MKFDLPRSAKCVAQAWAALGIAFYSISGLAYLYFGSRPVTHQDFWRLYQIGLTHSWLQSALLKYGPHSLFFPSLLWLANLHLFHAEQQPLVIAGILLLSMTVSLLLIPIWRDNIGSLTTKALSMLVLVVINFWMGRASITASGGYNCICSLVMLGVAIAFFVLPRMNDRSHEWLEAAVIVVCAGFLASFSFGSGLAIWPTLLLLAWCLRLRFYSIGVLGASSMVAAIIFVMLPERDASWQMDLLPSIARSAGIWLCQIIGSPPAYAVAGWRSPQLLYQTVDSSISIWFGAIGLMVAIPTIGYALIRRNIGQSRLKFTGTALTIFNLLVAISIVATLPLTRGDPPQVDAPRYLFWSTLFWCGLLLLLIARSENVSYLRWLAFCICLAIPIFAFPSHQRWAFHARYAQRLCDNAATSLINGVHDVEEVKIIAPVYAELTYTVAPLLRARRLDMFAEGLQDWIGQPVETLFDGRHEHEDLKGILRVEALVDEGNGQLAARVIGTAFKSHKSVPGQLVIIDPSGTICGIARSAGSGKVLNQILYAGKFPINHFLGYIRDYDPKLRYVARSADHKAVSDEMIDIETRTPAPAPTVTTPH